MSRFTLLGVAGLLTVGGLCVVVGSAHLLHRQAARSERSIAAVLLAAYGATLVWQPTSWQVIDLAVLLGATGAVLMLTRGLPTTGAVVVFLVVAAFVDFVSFSGGLTRTLIDRYRAGTDTLLLNLTLVLPIAGRPRPIVGIGDLAVGGAAASALLRLGCSPARVAITLGLGLTAALAYGVWRGGAPAIPFIAAAVMGMVWLSRRNARTRIASLDGA